MAATGLFSMAPYQWTPTAQLAMQGLQLAGNMAAAHDKKIKQTTTVKQNTPKLSTGQMIGAYIGQTIGRGVDPLNANGDSASYAWLGTKLAGGSNDQAMVGYQYGDYMAQNYSLGASMQRYGPLFANIAGNFVGGML